MIIITGMTGTSMTKSAGKRQGLPPALLAIGAGACLALGCYAAVGVWQANALYEGERAAANIRFWGPIAAFFLLLGLYLMYRMYRTVANELQRSLDKD